MNEQAFLDWLRGREKHFTEMARSYHSWASVQAAAEAVHRAATYRDVAKELEARMTRDKAAPDDKPTIETERPPHMIIEGNTVRNG